MIYLYIKTHNKTGLKYFGKTVQDPHTYKGSGIYWRNHIKKHGNDVTTEVYGSYDEDHIDQCRDDALQFSVDNNIVESVAWANLKLETLDGGFDHINSQPLEVRKKWIRDWLDSLSDEERSSMNAKKARKGEDNGMYGVHRYGEAAPRWGIPTSDETRQKQSEVKKNRLVVRDAETGETIGAVAIDDPNVLSGKWVSINRGRKYSAEVCARRSVWTKELGIRPPSPAGKLWWNDGTTQIRSATCPGEGFVRGRLKKTLDGTEP